MRELLFKCLAPIRYVVARSLVAAHRFGMFPEPLSYIGPNGCIHTAASFLAWNQIEGDYLEFGVYRGESFATSYQAITTRRKQHISNGFDTPEYNAWKNSPPRFFAFDCFEGLPGGGDEDRMVDYYEGSYACSEKDFLDNIAKYGVDLKSVQTVKGLYDQTCTDSTKQKYQIQKAAMIFIDCDLYESTVPALNFVTDLVQQGTIIIFQDWFRFKGNPNAGEQRACNEWLAANPHLELIEYWREGPQSVAFLVNFKPQ